MPQVAADSFFAKAIRISFYTLFLLTPLILWTKTSEVFEFNKMLLVYLITIIISTSWIIKSVQEKKFTVHRTPLDIPLLTFLLSQIISTVLSINPHTSIWGYYSRFHGGLASTISYTILFYAFIAHFSGNRRAINNIIYSILVSGFLVSLYGILEHFGIDKNVWVQDVQNRVFSTLGQPNWLSAYLIAILPLPIILLSHSKKTSHVLLFGSLSLLNFITILYTKSRSGIGATIIVLLLTLAYLTIKSIKSKGTKTPLLLLTSFIIVISFLIGTPWTPNPTQLSKTLEVGGPLLPGFEKYLNKINLTSQIKEVATEKLTEQEKWQYDLESRGVRVGGSNSMDIRNVVWQGAIELGKRFPFFGPGVETFGYTYYNVRPATHNLLSEWDFLYNKAHNEYLNFLATTGFVGLASYLILIASSITVFIQATRKLESPLPAALLLGFISILITNYFGFSVVMIALFFFLFPCLIIALSEDSHKQVSVPVHFPTITMIFALIIGLYATSKVITTWTADIAYAGGKSLLQYGPTYLSDALSLLNSAVDTNKNEPLYKSILAESQAQAALYLNEQIKKMDASTSADTKKKYELGRDEFIFSALANSQKAIDMNPHHTNFYKSRAKVSLYLSSIKPDYYNDVITTLLKVSELAPTDAKAIYNLGLVYLNMGKKEEATIAFQKALDLKSDYAEAKTRLDELSKPQGNK